ncbi:hypothetical protein BDP27DRAFT_980947 [Rhodocollybia butyracea]|uniref:Transmembrane protein n=1 Tax=Rhodocollybia butyracea TaxID=206335 RepID=A0A9P5U4K5_9AGAR|nr:hypothetical protein BDP27DRAFT_980947 [Rhodocollybia butyracea]
MMYAIEMQRIPKLGPNDVYTNVVQAAGARTASKIQRPPLAYVPLRPRRKIFYSSEDKVKYYRERLELKIRTRRNLHRFRICRAILYSLIALTNTIILILLLVSLGLGSGTVWESLYQIPAWLSLILIASFLLHRLKYRMFQTIKLRNFAVYTALTLLALSTASWFTIRIQNGVMCRDFSALEPTSCHTAQFLVAISWFTVAVAAAGNGVTYCFGKFCRPVEQVPQPLHDPVADLNLAQKTSGTERPCYYEDMPPPRRVQSVDLQEGWVDVPLYV